MKDNNKAISLLSKSMSKSDENQDNADYPDGEGS